MNNLFDDTEQPELFAQTEEPSVEPSGTRLTLSDGQPLPNADVVLYPGFFSRQDSDKLFTELLNGTKWRQDKMQLYGKEIDLPRQTAWYGDNDKDYTFSGITMNPESWTPTLLDIKEKVEGAAGATFNSVLLNHYRSGSDSISWHTDAERELGQNPVIASVTFGDARRFMLRHMNDKDIKTEVELSHGSLLVMGGETQHFWQHQVPKTKANVESRINLTFRQIKAK